MVSYHIKPGQCVTIGGAVVRVTEGEDNALYLSVDAPEGVPVARGRRKSEKKPSLEGRAAPEDPEELRARFRALVRELAEAMPPVDTPEWKERTGELVSELAFALTEQGGRQRRRTRQAEGIEAAKGKGVRFGQKARPLPENFERMRLAWRGGQVTLRMAADACGMAKSTFRDAALRLEGAQAGGGETERAPGGRENRPVRPDSGPAVPGARAGGTL